MPIRVLIADDEPAARRRLLRFVRGEPDTEIVAICHDCASLRQALEEGGADVAVIDIALPGGSGLDVLTEFDVGATPDVIFVTAHERFAVQAFAQRAVDYLLKPVTAARFHLAFDQVRERRAERAAATNGRLLEAMLEGLSTKRRATDGEQEVAPTPPSLPAPTSFISRFTVRVDRRIVVVPVSTVDHLEAYGNYVRLHVGRRTHLIRDKIGRVAAALDPAQFARVHRRSVVNLARVVELQPWFSGDYVILLVDGTKIRLARSYRDEFIERLRTP